MGKSAPNSLIPASIYFCWSTVQKFSSWAATTLLAAACFVSYYCCFWAASCCFFIWAIFSCLSFSSFFLFSTSLSLRAWISFALAITSFWDLPTNSAITRHLSTVPAGNLTIPSVSYLMSSRLQFLLINEPSSWFLSSSSFCCCLSLSAYSFFMLISSTIA